MDGDDSHRNDSIGTDSGQAGSEELLWKLAEVDGSPAGPTSGADTSWSEADLVAYRQGALDPPDRERLEWILAEDPSARRQLLALADVAQEPPAEIRQRVLESVHGAGTADAAPPRLPANVRPFTDQRPAGRRLAEPRRWMPALAAAAALAVAVLGPWGPGGERSDHSPGSDGSGAEVGGLGTVALPPELDFVVRLEGAASIRSSDEDASMPEPGAEASTTAVAPGQKVRWVIEPRDRAVAGLDFGLYALRQDRWRRLQADDGVVVDLGRGTAVFEARASEVAGATTGQLTVLLAVAPQGQLPDSLTVPPGDDVAAELARRSRGWARSQTIILESEHHGSGEQGD